MPRQNKLVQCKYRPIPDTCQLLSLATVTKNMRAGILRNYICELTTTRIIVRGRI